MEIFVSGAIATVTVLIVYCDDVYVNIGMHNTTDSEASIQLRDEQLQKYNSCDNEIVMIFMKHPAYENYL